MPILDTSFGDFQLERLAHLNIRLEFNHLLSLLRTEPFRSRFEGIKGLEVPVQVPFGIWLSSSNSLITLLLREGIVGLEAYVSGAVYFEALYAGWLSDELLEMTVNPFVLRGRGTADNVYNRLPAQLDPSFTLEAKDPELWARVQAFYREVRNKLFHGFEIYNRHTATPLWHCYEFLWKVFQWIDTWHSPQRLVASLPIHWGPGQPRFLFPEGESPKEGSG